MAKIKYPSKEELLETAIDLVLENPNQENLELLILRGGISYRQGTSIDYLIPDIVAKCLAKRNNHG